MRANRQFDQWMLITLGVAVALFILIQLIRVIPNLWHHRNSSRWPTTKAITLTSSTMSEGRSGGVMLSIQYSYHVTEYESGEYRRGFDSQEDADAFFASLEDEQLTVRFDPQSPSVSELVIN